MLSLDDFPNPHPNGIGLTFNYVVWQMIRLQQRCHIDIRKPSNPYRCDRGPNPWDYYFDQEPCADATPAIQDDSLALAGNRAWDIAHQRALRLHVEHIKLLPELAAEVAAFRAQNFRGKVLGVHLRGTDKATEYTPLSRHEISALIDPLICELNPDTIFLQTDDVNYWEHMQQYNPVSLNIPRSNKSQHHHPPLGRYASGRAAVVDGFLGAACDYYARTPSNFSTISLIMGNHGSIHLLNKHCQIDPFPTALDTAIGL